MRKWDNLDLIYIEYCLTKGNKKELNSMIEYLVEYIKELRNGNNN